MVFQAINAIIVREEIKQPQIKFAYPRVEGLSDLKVQQKINKNIRDLVQEMIENPQPGGQLPGKPDISGDYKVEVNRNGVLSIRFSEESYVEHAAHPFTRVDSRTYNLENGQVYELSDLFRPGSDYVARINASIKLQFKEKQLPTIREFETISNDQNFYLTDTDLVIYFQLYEYTPYYVGIPEFSIPYSSLADIINPRGPIAKLYPPPSRDNRPPRIRFGYR
ncbi:MAG: DUF3298 domain-containing protein, partial [Syntrophomonadaceae bacterium]|nr:DUF3298 domain-containing protein [Syntrophomonadaceae bacterium]